MENATPIIQCQSLNCLSPNPITNKFCEKCGTPLVKRYLWLLGDWVRSYYRAGELILDRYQVVEPQIVLDTKPSLAPQGTDRFPPFILPYLKLFSHRLHVPQIYDYLPPPDERISSMDIWFLEYGTVPLQANGQLQYPHLLPNMTDLWNGATSMRQLHWLWQIAKLWEPLQSQGVVSSLLNPALIRVNDRIIQLLELQLDPDPSPSLKDLAELWSQLLPYTDLELLPFLDPLVDRLSQGDIEQPEALSSLLDTALYHYGQTQKRTYHIYTCTDAGKVREHNEDACYPPPNQSLTVQDPQDSLVIVCDGIGGQEGGEIASQLAIENLQAQIFQGSRLRSENDSEAQSRRLAEALQFTNKLIAGRNDAENRLERQRMGTTVVMSLARDHEVYIGHVGDSRAYWITPTSCHQITVDDDLASREVRLGYLIYRDAIQYPNSGALVQALGTSNANKLYPAVERFMVDEDCVFLLCSDGLSDNDRVEQYWLEEIVPLLGGQKSVGEVGEALLRIANEQNGHDNSTIALLYAQVQPQVSSTPIPSFEEMRETSLRCPSMISSLSDQRNAGESFPELTENDIPTEAAVKIAPTPASPPKSRPNLLQNPLSWLLGTLGAGVFLGAAGWGWYLWKQSRLPVPPLEPAGVYRTTATLQLLANPDTRSSQEIQAGTVVRLSPDNTNSELVRVTVCLPNDPISGWLERSQLTTLLPLDPNLSVDGSQCSSPTP